MTDRIAELQSLLDGLQAGLAARADSVAGAAAALTRVQSAMATVGPSGSTGPDEGVPQAVDAWLPAALARAEAAGGTAAATAKALAALGPKIHWYRREGLEAPDDFPDKHALATLIGPADRPGALEVRDDLRVGVSLVAPYTCYPDHRHPPEELYLALTGGEWRQDMGPWFEPEPGGIVFNTSNILHGMRAGAEPQLALWCLPIP